VDSELNVRSLTGEPLPSLQCVALNDRGMSAEFHSFSVTFAGPADQALTQGTVVVEAPGHPAAYVFFTPTGVRDEQMHYEAVFNQPATDEEQR
jgi:hypothetical protein